jgi:hypothetical protein
MRITHIRFKAVRLVFAARSEETSPVDMGLLLLMSLDADWSERGSASTTFGYTQYFIPPNSQTQPSQSRNVPSDNLGR